MKTKALCSYLMNKIRHELVNFGMRDNLVSLAMDILDENGRTLASERTPVYSDLSSKSKYMNKLVLEGLAFSSEIVNNRHPFAEMESKSDHRKMEKSIRYSAGFRTCLWTCSTSIPGTY